MIEVMRRLLKSIQFATRPKIYVGTAALGCPRVEDPLLLQATDNVLNIQRPSAGPVELRSTDSRGRLFPQ